MKKVRLTIDTVDGKSHIIVVSELVKLSCIDQFNLNLDFNVEDDGVTYYYNTNNIVKIF